MRAGWRPRISTIADLDGDGRLDVVASGRRTANVRIYWNRTGVPASGR